MWYSDLIGTDNVADRLIKYAMKKQAASTDELWQALKETGIADKLGVQGKKDFEQQMMQQNPSFAQSISQQAQTLQQKQQEQLQQSYANYVSGRVLAEEIGRARQQAAMEGRQPLVSELRAARRRANERLSEEGFFGEGLGIPTQIHVGRRGPLGRIRLKPTDFPTGQVKEAQIQALANQILAEEQERMRFIAQQRFERGESPSPEPTAADMRAVVHNVNQRLKEGLQFQVGTRGPLPAKFELNRNIEHSKEYYEWKERQKKKENLGLNDILDVEPGNIAIPHPGNVEDAQSPEEAEIIQREQENFDRQLAIINKQANYAPKPPLHHRCRCKLYPLGKTYIWQTAGDDRVCDDCKDHAEIFNNIKN